jgi:class 3 adenylate cyclase
MLRKLYITIILFLFYTHFYAQPIKHETKKGYAINNFIKAILWEDEEDIDTFRIGFLGEDTAVFNAFQKAISINTPEKIKEYKIIKYSSISEIKAIQILFISKEYTGRLGEIYKMIRGKNVLLISDESENTDHIMIDFLREENKNLFRINGENIAEANLILFPVILKYLGENIDWQEYFREFFLILRKEKSKVREQKENLLIMEKEINKKIEELKALQHENRNLARDIEKQKENIRVQDEKLSKLRSQALIQQEILKKKSKILDEKEIEINIKNDEIKKQIQVLQKQEKEIDIQTKRIEEQKSILHKQLEKIKTQRLILYLFIIIILLISVMGYFVYRAYQIKKRANKELKEKNDKITEQNRKISKQKEEIELEKEKSDKLLLNILPIRVANDLKISGKTTPQVFKNVTVYFSDIVGFTNMSTQLSPQELIDELNEIFTAFDNIFEKHSCERIKTIGDAYLAVCGMPAEDVRHAENVVDSAIKIMQYLKKRNEKSRVKWKIRIGIHSGSVVGGVVGIKKYIYDVFGDTINTASRMESNSESMMINISENTKEIIKDKYDLIKRKGIEVKGKGKMKMYFVKY